MWQPDLLKGKRQRPKKTPPALEVRTHIAIADLLRINARKDWRWTHFPSGELRTPATAEKLQRMGVTAGWFDFLLVDPQGVHYWLELKRGKLGRMSPAQTDMADFFCHARVNHAICNSFEEAKRALEIWGILRRPIT